MRNKRDWWIVFAIAGLLYVLISLIYISNERSKVLFDNGETRKSVQMSINRLLPKEILSMRDPRLITGLNQLKNESFITSIWAVDPNGTIVYAWRGPGKEGDNVRALASKENISAILDSIEPNSLTEIQKLQLLTAGAIQRDGDHNDVWRHLIHPTTDSSGNLIALIAIAFDVNAQTNTSLNLIDILVVFITSIAFIAYWFGLTIWTYLDARERGESAILWGILVLLTNLIGLFTYLIMKTTPQEPTPEI